MFGTVNDELLSDIYIEKNYHSILIKTIKLSSFASPPAYA